MLHTHLDQLKLPVVTTLSGIHFGNSALVPSKGSGDVVLKLSRRESAPHLFDDFRRIWCPIRALLRYAHRALSFAHMAGLTVSPTCGNELSTFGDYPAPAAGRRTQELPQRRPRRCRVGGIAFSEQSFSDYGALRLTQAHRCCVFHESCAVNRAPMPCVFTLGSRKWLISAGYKHSGKSACC